MKSQDALRVLAEITAYQWGMVTASQASTQGVSRLDLSRLTDGGHLDRLAHGVYKDSGTPSDQFEDLRAAWLSTEPKVMGEARIQERANGIVVAGTSAAGLYGIGDLWTDRHEFVSPERRQSQRTEIRYRKRSLDPHDVTLAQGLPTMTIERTIADLVEEVGDHSLVADALRDGAFKRNLDLDRLQELLSPLAARNGLKKDDGAKLLNQLLETAGIDTDTVATRIAADPALGSRVAASYLANLPVTDLNRLMMTPVMQRSMRTIHGSIAAKLDDALAPQLAELAVGADASLAVGADAWLDRLVASGALDSFSKRLADSIATDCFVTPETLSAVRLAQETRADE